MSIWQLLTGSDEAIASMIGLLILFGIAGFLAVYVYIKVQQSTPQ